jgi:hypothetical protein
MCDHSLLFTSLAQSLVKLPIVGTEPRERPVINHVRVTNVLTGETRFHSECGCIPGTRSAAPLGGSKRLTHWTNETVFWSEIAGPPQYLPAGYKFAWGWQIVKSSEHFAISQVQHD